MAKFSFSSVGGNPQTNLFGLPLPLAEDSVYLELNLDPSASAQDVGWAVKLLNDQRRLERVTLETAVKETIAKVPGLSEVYADVERQTNDQSDGRRVKRLVDLEQKALVIDPAFHEKRRRIKELRDKIDELNGLDLGSLAGLAKYDEARPPFALMKLAPAERDRFLEEPRTLLWAIRRDITRFLERQGESVAYSSDFDREDFTADFSPCRLLDGKQ